MKDLKEYLVTEKSQDWKYFAKNVISNLTEVFENHGKKDDEETEWFKDIVEPNTDLYDSIYRLYECWKSGEYKFSDTVK